MEFVLGSILFINRATVSLKTKDRLYPYLNSGFLKLEM